jgi:hypothetical protein
MAYLKSLVSSRPAAIFVSYVNTIRLGGPGSVVGIATAYGLDGPGIESRWGRDFPHLSRPALRLTQPPVQWVPLLSLRTFVAYETVKSTTYKTDTKI